jgi:homogentisate phytyltransferase/homogentisate geranylgeranyltransferase
LTLFVLPFGFAIAVLKDVPDAAGDSQFDIRTFTVRLGGRAAFRIGMTALTLAYLGMAVLGPIFLDGGAVLIVTNLGALALLYTWAARVDLDNFTPFYMRVWGLFFLEYLIVPAAILSGS